MKTITAIICAYNEECTIKEFVSEGHQIALTAFNNYKLISKVIKNNLNKI